MKETIKDNSIIICNPNYKFKILKNINKLIDIKFMSMNEFIKSYYFDYDEKTILYIIKKYNVSYDVALEYLENIYYIEDKKYSSEKLNFLVDLKRELIENNLLIFNPSFKKYIKNKNIIIYNYILNKFENHVLSNLNNIYIIKDKLQDYKPIIYEFNNVEEEVEFVAYKISELIKSGVKIDKIKLININKDYINIINKIFGFYNLKIDKFHNISIKSNIIGSTFNKNLTNNLQQAINSIKQYEGTDTYNKIIDICNKYIWCEDFNDLKILITNDLNNTYIKNINYTNTIEVVDYKNYIFDDEYVFMLGFNQGIIPIVYKDEDYITDNIKPDYLDKTSQKNKKEKQETIQLIKNIKNLIITYKLQDSFNTYYPSCLIDELNSEVKKTSLDLTTSYSDISNKLKFSIGLDNLIKFGIKSTDLELLNSNYNIPYNTYSNEFTGLSKVKLNKYINNLNKFNLSYSSVDNYNRCQFRFYIDKILCLNKNNEDFGIILGNIYHYVLEKYLKNAVNIEQLINNYIKENNIVLNNSQKFFINKTKENIEFLIKTIKKQNSFSKLNNFEVEKYITMPIKDNISLVGFIDKILLNDDSNVGVIIDYKTYIKNPSLKYINYGIGLQLPIYMLLSKSQFNNIRFVGFYLQNILLDNKSDKEKEESLKLIGYTNLDRSLLEQFDYNYMDSSVINGIKLNNDGSFSANSIKNMLTDEKINNIIEMTKKQVDNTINMILDSNFNINPKYNKLNIGCEFCKKRDLCYMNESNYIYIHSNE